MKDWDPPLLNQPQPTPSVAAEWITFEARKIVENSLALAQIRRVHELRKSMGVESTATSTVNIRIPPRYGKKP